MPRTKRLDLRAWHSMSSSGATVSFCVPQSHFDQVAEKLGYYYVRNGDYYAGKDHLAEQLGTRH